MKNETNKCRGCPHNKLLEETNWHYCDGDKCEVKIRADERAKTIEEAEKLLNKIAPDKVAEIKCDDGEIRNRPLIDFGKVYEIFEHMKGYKND